MEKYNGNTKNKQIYVTAKRERVILSYLFSATTIINLFSCSCANPVRFKAISGRFYGKMLNLVGLYLSSMLSATKLEVTVGWERVNISLRSFLW